MSLSLGVIRDALAAQLKANIARGVNVYARYPDVSVEMPSVIVAPASAYVSYHEAFAQGLGEVQLEIRVHTQGDDAGERVMDDLLSAGTGEESSVIDALEMDRTLGGVVSDCLIRTARNEGRVDLAADGQSSRPAWRTVLDVAIYLPRT